MLARKRKTKLQKNKEKKKKLLRRKRAELRYFYMTSIDNLGGYGIACPSHFYE
jgi:hypothetical protein